MYRMTANQRGGKMMTKDQRDRHAIRIVDQQWYDYLAKKTKLHPLAVIRLRELRSAIKKRQ